MVGAHHAHPLQHPPSPFSVINWPSESLIHVKRRICLLLTIHLFIHPSVHSFIHSFIRPFIHPSIQLFSSFIHLLLSSIVCGVQLQPMLMLNAAFVCFLIPSSIHASIHSFFRPFSHPPIHSSVHVPINSSTYFSVYLLTLSLPRVINFKFPLQLHQKYNITQYEELDFPSLALMKDDYTTNSHSITYTFLFKSLGEFTFGTWDWKG